MTIILDTLSAELTEALRKKAEAEGRSIKDVASEAIARGLEVKGDKEAGSPKTIDGTGIAGTMSEEDARTIEEAVEWMDRGIPRGDKKRDLSRFRGTWVEDP